MQRLRGPFAGKANSQPATPVPKHRQGKGATAVATVQIRRGPSGRLLRVAKLEEDRRLRRRRDKIGNVVARASLC